MSKLGAFLLVLALVLDTLHSHVKLLGGLCVVQADGPDFAIRAREVLK